MPVVMRGMAERRYGQVVSISSDAGRVGLSGQAVYSGCKAGVIAMSKTLEREFARSGITFNTVSPGPTKTPMMEAAFEGATARKPSRFSTKCSNPFRFVGSAFQKILRDCGVPRKRRSFITGQVISVSGGLTMHG
jgi:2-hydroxycyclohexanecarboxyl-CoA dehydrogenase